MRMKVMSAWGYGVANGRCLGTWFLGANIICLVFWSSTLFILLGVMLKGIPLLNLILWIPFLDHDCLFLILCSVEKIALAFINLFSMRFWWKEIVTTAVILPFSSSRPQSSSIDPTILSALSHTSPYHRLDPPPLTLSINLLSHIQHLKSQRPLSLITLIPIFSLLSHHSLILIIFFLISSFSSPASSVPLPCFPSAYSRIPFQVINHACAKLPSSRHLILLSNFDLIPCGRSRLYKPPFSRHSSLWYFF